MGHNKSLEEVLEGVLFFHSETGTEGGYWAFQDKRFITKTLPSFGVFANLNVWDLKDTERKGKAQNNAEVFLNNKWLPHPDPMTDEPDYFISSLFQGEERGYHEADKRLMKKYGFKIKYAAETMDERYGKGNWHIEDPNDPSIAIIPDGTREMFGGIPSTKPDRPYSVPENGLTRVTVEWDDGTIEHKRLSNTLLEEKWEYGGLHILQNGDKLTIYHPEDNKKIWSGPINLREHDLFTEDAFGLWIHTDQIGIKRETWAEYFFEKYPAKLILANKK
ncbi:MAG: hypothetical protein U9Q69_06415 [Nanoarchaeota archaeon]|nr:hypothetical protein [Nanoarchaeota archaeon]